MFTRSGKHVWEGHAGRVACDHYNRYREDVAIMREIGLKAYRFSVSWPRVIPAGTGKINTAGLDFYDRLVDELLKNGIEPWLTLFHWDFPYALFLRGGWLNPESPKWFAAYVKAVVDRLSDRVRYWITVNEPQAFIMLGHSQGQHAPGLRLDMEEALLAAHHSLLAHGRAVQVIRAAAKSRPLVGWSSAGSVYTPATNSVEDINAARNATLAVYPDSLWNNRWWGDPVVHGIYPQEGIDAYGESNLPRFTQADLATIQQPLDFYGYNIFSAVPVKAGPDGRPVPATMVPGHADTHYLWKQVPEALYWGPRFLAEHYKLPIVVTENGMSNCDCVAVNGRVNDPNRIDYMNRYLLELKRALAEGIDVRGYFAWSLMDNFEWAEGYKHRFGLVYVDFKTQRRTLKDSAFWYRDIISSNGASLESIAEPDAELHIAVKETMRYIQSHISEPFKIKDLANRLRCHPDFLSRQFKKSTGIDLSQYIRQVRIDHARDLLKNPKVLVDDVAVKCGFSDQTHFRKVFRRLTGHTPAEFQRRHKILTGDGLPKGANLRVPPPPRTQCAH
jgi:beta-glucosidase